MLVLSEFPIRSTIEQIDRPSQESQLLEAINFRRSNAGIQFDIVEINSFNFVH